MHKTKKDVDAKVRVALNKLRSESERNLRGFRIAKLYYNINELATAEQYLCSYLSVKTDDADAHKLLGQIYVRLKKVDKALEAFQQSLQLNAKQPGVLTEVCKLLLEDKNLSCKKAKYWCDLAESEHVQNDTIFALRLKLTKQDSFENDQTESLLQKEIATRPNYVQLRIYLVRYYMDQNQIFNAFQYVHQVEKLQKDEFINSNEWYNTVFLVLSKYEQLPTAKKDWDFWLLLISCLERQVQNSFTLNTTGLIETINFLFNLDQYLYKFSQIHEMLCAQKEMVELLLHHYRGQFLLHTIALIFKRELMLNTQRWRETARIVLPLLLLAYQVEPRQNKQPWMKHCDEHGTRLIILWQREASFRCAQVGRTLLSYVNDRKTVDKEKSSQHNRSRCDLLDQIRQICSNGQWRRNIFAALFCNSDQKSKEQSSFLIKCPKFYEPVYELPSTADIERYEEDAQFLRPQSLQHAVYLCLCNNNLASVRARYFNGLSFSTQNLNVCSAESLNQLDIDSFMYAAAIQAKRSLEVEREAYENYHSGNSNVIGKPYMLPFVLLESQLCTDKQAQWWCTAYKVYKNLSNGTDLAELRGILQYGIQVIRGVNGPKFDMAIVFKIGQIFVERAKGNIKQGEKCLLDARAESTYKYGLKLLKMHRKGLLEAVPKYFTYAKFRDFEKDFTNAAEDAASYLAGRYFEREEFEDLIEELTGLQLPFASYWQAEAYRKLDQASKTPKQMKRLYKEKTGDCLKQTLTFLKSPNADPNHRLNSIIHDEIRTLHQFNASHLNESGNYFSPQNNSTIYHDAEDDFQRKHVDTPPPLSGLGSSQRARRHDTTTSTASSKDADSTTESLIKQMSSTLILLKKEILENVKPEVQRVNKEIVLMNEKITGLEQALKAACKSTNPPSRDEALNMLDDFYVIDDALQQQLYQQQQQQQQQQAQVPTSHVPPSRCNSGNSGLGGFMANNPLTEDQTRLQMPAPIQVQANAFNNPMIPQPANYPVNVCGHNQSNPYLMPIVPSPMVAHNDILLPTSTLQVNKSVGNQSIENGPPANVVITNSDPLPNTNIISLQSQQQPTLSVTIPPHHLKANTAVSQNSDSRGSIMPTFNKNLAPADTTTKSTAQTVTSTPTLGTMPAFSFKPQIITAAAAASTIHSNEEQNRTIDSSCRDTNKSSAHRPASDKPLSEFKTATSTSDETVLHTREKAEEVIFCYRAILFHHIDKEWKERGIGDIKIVKDKEGTYRILMRNDQTHKICANHNLTSEILLTIPENETKGFIWAANDFADGLLRPEKYFVRFKTSEIAAKFQEAFAKAQQEVSKSKNKASITNVQTNASAIPIIPTAASSAQASRSESISSESNPALTTAVEASKMPANTFSGIPNFSKTMTSIGISPTSIFPPTINSLSASPFASIFNNLNNFANPPILPNATLTQSCNNATSDLLNKTTPISLPDLIEVSTDEESEIILFEQRAKLMRYDKEASGWKEKCLGNIQLLQNKNDPNMLRLVMRRDETHKQCCNQPVYKNTVFKSVKNSQTTLSWAGQDFCGREPVAEMLTVRFKTPEICKQFHDIIIKAQNQMSVDEGVAFPLSSNKNESKSENKSDLIDRNANQEGFGDAFKPKPGSWICSVCYITNAADKLHCVACDLPKEKTLLLKGPNSSKTVPSVKATFNFGTGPNVAQLQSATTPNPFTFSKSDATTKPITVTPATQTAAGKEKIVSAPENFGDQFKAKAGSWTCSSCYLINNDGLVHCIACDAPRSGTILEEASTKNAPNIEQNFSFGVKVADDNEEQAKSNFDFTFGSGSVAATNTFTFPKPLATSSTLSSIDNVDASSSVPAASTSNTTETLFSNTTEASGESAPNPFSFSRKGFTFAFKPKSPGRSVKSPVKFGGGDADGGGDEDVESQYLEEEENNTHFTPVIPLPEKVEAKTGEEEEEILYIHRAKLYRFTEGEWKERGLGNVKILRHLVTKRLRVVMRRDQVLKICLNHALNEDLEYKRKDDKSWLFAVNDFSEEIMELQKFSLRFKNKKIAEDFMEAVMKALDGSALPILETNCGSISTEKSVTRKPPASAFNISEENEKLANELKLPLEFFAAKPPCSGCRGCDADNFTFIASKDNEVFVSREDTKHRMLPMELPSLILIKQNTLSSVVLAATTTKTPSTSINFKKKLVDTFIASENSTPKTNENVTFKSGAQEDQSSSNLFTTRSPFGDENKTMFSGAANNATFTIGNNTQSTSIFGGTGSGVQGASIFGQKSSLFDNNASVFGTKSIFSFSANNSSQIASNNSIFGSSFTSFTGFSPNKIGESGGYIFGNTASANVQSGGSIFGGFSTATNSSTAETAKCMDLSKTATAAIDFATLAEKASKDAKNDSFLAKGNTKHAPGEFIGLVNQDAFANFDKAAKNQKSNGSNEKNIPGNTSNNSQNNIEGDGDNENKINAENYDPHYEPIIALPDEIVVTTGEEEESKLFGERASLYRWDSTNKEWKERGVGELKILFHRDKGTYRMLMRREQIHKLVLNHRIGADFVFNNLSKNPKSFAWASMNYAESSEGVLEKLAVRFNNEKLAKQFSEQLKECVEACKKRNNEID
uniref:E3 SUMO-protein ligase RanBP2 n=1 Tax=Glossina morsitans morsitans TaxID=37546 RepID=A0A1A9YUI2_GLOMM